MSPGGIQTKNLPDHNLDRSAMKAALLFLAFSLFLGFLAFWTSSLRPTEKGWLPLIYFDFRGILQE